MQTFDDLQNLGEALQSFDDLQNFGEASQSFDVLPNSGEAFQSFFEIQNLYQLKLFTALLCFALHWQKYQKM